MTSPADMKRGLALCAYLGASHLIPVVAKPLLRRRQKRGKEHPTRWVEKLGQNLAPRPAGPLMWLHAVGLGEVMSLRGLIEQLGVLCPDLSFLVTSSTAASASVFAKNIPPRTVHQFLPLDAPKYRRRFLDHFEPDICVWVEQDLWPGMVSDLAKRGTTQAIIAARMNTQSKQRHQKVGSLFRDIYGAMDFVAAQDERSALHLAALGADVQVRGSLKPAAPPLAFDPQELSAIKATLEGRRIWAVAPAHDDDVVLARKAHAALCQSDHDALLIIVPRFPTKPSGIDGPKRSEGRLPQSNDQIWLCDTFGELGLVYRLADTVLIGGTFGVIEGHNPWEAAALDCAILHGPRTGNFTMDFAQLKAAEAAFMVSNATELAEALMSENLRSLPERAKSLTETARGQVAKLAVDLVALIERTDAA